MPQNTGSKVADSLFLPVLFLNAISVKLNLNPLYTVNQ